MNHKPPKATHSYTLVFHTPNTLGKDGDLSKRLEAVADYLNGVLDDTYNHIAHLMNVDWVDGPGVYYDDSVPSDINGDPVD